MKIQIIGEGIKECTLAETLERYGDHEVIVTPGNDGSRNLMAAAGVELPEDADFNDIFAVADLFKPELIIFLDERAALSGLKKQLKERGFEVFAPDRERALMLDSKDEWTSFFEKHGLHCADCAKYDSLEASCALIDQTEGPWVMKEKTGKRRFSIPYSSDEALDILREWFERENTEVLISPFYHGIRFNVPVLVYEDQVLPFDTCVLQRGVYDGEDDPQQKGMGAFAPASSVVDQGAINSAILDVLIPFFRKLNEEGIPYEGFASGEFIIGDKGLTCINIKCGLSECGACSILLRNRNDIAQIIHRLKNREIIDLKFTDKNSCTVMLVGKDYPDAPSIGAPIEFDEDLEGGIYPYHAKYEDGVLRSNGGRVIAAAALGKDLKEASEKARLAASQIHCDDLIYRNDIGDLTVFLKD